MWHPGLMADQPRKFKLAWETDNKNFSAQVDESGTGMGLITDILCQQTKYPSIGSLSIWIILPEWRKYHLSEIAHEKKSIFRCLLPFFKETFEILSLGEVAKYQRVLFCRRSMEKTIDIGIGAPLKGDTRTDRLGCVISDSCPVCHSDPLNYNDMIETPLV